MNVDLERGERGEGRLSMEVEGEGEEYFNVCK